MRTPAELQVSRSEQLLKILRQTGSVSVEALCEQLGVSVATVRRDLQTLQKRGLLRRTHGGAEILEPLLYEPFRHDSTFQDQLTKQADEKRRIGAAAANLVPEGAVIALTAGTTTTEVIRNLKHRTGITVVTNTVNVAMELSQQQNLKVFVTGGYLRGDWFSLVGASAARALRDFHLDIVFLGANAVDPIQGPACHNPEEASINHAMVQQARRCILVADHSKFSATAAHRICTVREIQTIVTDTAAQAEQTAPYADLGIEIIRV